MRGRVALYPLAGIALAGCFSAGEPRSIPPIGAGEVERERAAYTNQKRHFGLLGANVCKNLDMTEGCRTVTTGAATAEAVEGRLTAGGRMVESIFVVRLSNGDRGYIKSLDFRLMDDDAEHQKKVAAQKECDRKGRNIHVGMTGAQVLASCWGKPIRNNRTITASGVREQWVYGNGSYVYVTDGVVTALQDSGR